MRQYHVFFSGRVQGVGFRYVSRAIARRHPITGWVRNLPDGRVELCLQGETAQVEAYLKDLRKEMLGYIQGESGEFEDATEAPVGFDIRH